MLLLKMIAFSRFYLLLVVYLFFRRLPCLILLNPLINRNKVHLKKATVARESVIQPFIKLTSEQVAENVYRRIIQPRHYSNFTACLRLLKLLPSSN